MKDVDFIAFSNLQVFDIPWHVVSSAFPIVNHNYSGLSYIAI
jgi:hypothetical protein